MVTTEPDTMPGQIPEPSVTMGSLPSLGPLAGISATTLTDKLKFGDFQEFGTMLSPLHFLDSLGKRPLMIKTEVWKTLFTVCKYEEIQLIQSYLNYILLLNSKNYVQNTRMFLASLDVKCPFINRFACIKYPLRSHHCAIS